jgi:hypothetical protein
MASMARASSSSSAAARFSRRWVSDRSTPRRAWPPWRPPVYGASGVEPAAVGGGPGRSGHRARSQAGAAVEPARGVGHLKASRARRASQRGGLHRRAGRGLARSRSRRRDDGGDQRAGHCCLPRREAGPVSAGGWPQPSAGPSACSSGALKRVMYHHSGCPRGDLNTETGAISLDRGNHAIRVTRAGPAGPAIRRRVRCLRCHLVDVSPGELFGQEAVPARSRYQSGADATIQDHEVIGG